MTKRQKEIVRIIQAMPDGEATVQQIFDCISWKHYFYTIRHLSPILSPMVKNRMIHRVRRGVYAVGAGTPQEAVDVNQINLFDNEH